jgi:8-hydroxy-5-deazaflavin:NADPH oxidoreductase
MRISLGISMKKIAAIGCGNVGPVLGRRWAEKGYDIAFGVRNPEKEKVQEVSSLENVKIMTIKAAAEWAEVIVYAAWWSAAESI